MRELFLGKGPTPFLHLGKGPTQFIHHFFDNHEQKESTLHLNADNCTGQNKNNAMIQVIILYSYKTNCK